MKILKYAYEKIKGKPAPYYFRGWKYYNHAAIPTSAPHESPNLTPIEDGSIFRRLDGTPLLARWTSDWDCGYETEWWYVIKDSPFDISALKSKRRYEINKGKRNFEVCQINPNDYIQDMISVAKDALSGWPEKYRPTVDESKFRLTDWNQWTVFGAFSLETKELCGYAQLQDFGSYVEFNILRVSPSAERLGINAAIVAGILENYDSRLGKNGFYINDGSRSIRHETAFQDYLEKYFGFRKAYCKLNLKYRNGFGVLVKALYPFRAIIKTDSGLGSQIAGILKLESIARE